MDSVAGSGGSGVVPARLVDKVARVAKDIVLHDELINKKLREGRSLIGLYPVTTESRVEYERRTGPRP